jgi:aminoglycoside 3-N-acetyltransferase
MSVRDSLETYLAHPAPMAIHAAFRALKADFESPREFVEFVLERRKNRVTMFPTFTGSAQDSAQNPPFLDVRTTPCYTGSVPTAALEVLGPAARTLHPTHSWAITGPKSEMHVVSGMYAMSPCGMGTPLTELTNMLGNVLLIGCDLNSLTLVHAAEEAANVPYVYLPEKVTCRVVDARGREQSGAFLLHSWETPRDFERIRPLLEADDAIVDEPWGMVIHGRMCYEAVRSKLREEPEFLVSR